MTVNQNSDNEGPDTSRTTGEPAAKPPRRDFPLLPRTIRSNLILLLAIVLLPLLVLQTAMYYSRFQERRAEELAANLDVARSVAVAFSSLVRDVTRQEAAVGDLIISLQSSSPQQIVPSLVDNARMYPSTTQWSWVSTQGIVIASNDPTAVGLSVGDRDYFRAIAGGEEWAISDLVESRLTGRPIYIVGRGVRDNAGIFRGVVSAVFDPATLGAVALPINLGASRSFAIADSQGTYVYGRPEVNLTWDQRRTYSKLALIHQALTGREVSGDFSLTGGEERIGAAVPIPGTDWAAAASRPDAVAISPVTGELLRDGGLFVFVAAVALLAALAVGSRITVPVRRLETNAMQVARGEPGEILEESGPLEVQRLAKALNLMDQQVKAREASLAQESRRSKEAANEAEAYAKRLWTIQYITEAALSHTGLDEMLKDLLLRLRTVLKADNATILLLSADGLSLTVRATSGLEEQAHDYEVPLGRGIAGRIAAYRETVIESDVADMEVWSPLLRARARSLIGSPLLAGGALVGVIHVDSTEPAHFSKDDVLFLKLVADRVSLAIQNARLFEESAYERERYRSFFESSIDAVLMTAPDGRILAANPAATKMFGWSEEEMLQLGPGGISDTSDPRLAAAFEERARTGKFVGELTFVRKDGTKFPGEVATAIFRDATGEERTSIVVRDLSQRKRDEEERSHLLEELRTLNKNLIIAGARVESEAEESRRRAAELDAAMSAMASGVIVYGPDGVIVQMNQAARRILGQEFGEAGVTPEDRSAVIRPLKADGSPFASEELPFSRALRGETVEGLEMQLLLRGRTIWVYVSAAPIRTADGHVRGAVVSLSDVTDRHALEEQREDILRTISHDLRNPLTAILGQAQLVLRAEEKRSADERTLRSLDGIIASAKRMNLMIGDLVELAQLESGQLPLERQEVELRTLLEAMLDRNRGIWSLQRIKVAMGRDLPPVNADPVRLERVFTNLISNALKYSPPAGEVIISAAENNGYMQVAVTDKGQGVPAEDLPHLFERYYRASGVRKTEGLGIGLYSSKMLIEAHGGRIWVESQPGEGSTFYFTIPVAVHL
jgi:PAS domain S-box-containing protein